MGVGVAVGFDSECSLFEAAPGKRNITGDANVSPAYMVCNPVIGSVGPLTDNDKLYLWIL